MLVRLLAALVPNAGKSNPVNLTDVNGTLYFTASDGTNGVELWKTEGTDAGTVMLKPYAGGINNTGDSNPANLTNLNGVLYFTATDGTNGMELWKTDGTNVGTVMLKPYAGGINNTGDSNPSYLTAFGATLFFAADDGTTNGRELWKSNGTDAGTQMAFNLNPNNNAGSNPTYITNANGVLCLAANNGTTGNELWESDGTLAGTSVYNINPSLLGAGSDPQNLTNVNDTLYFTADNGSVGRELFALKHNTAPVISSIEDQETYDNNPIKTEFSISDAQTPAKNLTLTVTSNNQTLLPNANIKLEGTGEARKLTLTPAANKTGTCIVTIVVRDPSLAQHKGLMLPGSRHR